MTHTSIRLTVIIPMFNEASGITPTLDALRAQTNQGFTVVLCDNASTDRTREVVVEYIARHSLDWTVVTESTKGTGAASDTAARAAIAAGATHLARTDADTIPDPDWTQRIAHEFDTTDVELIAGMIHSRIDSPRSTRGRRLMLRAATEVAIGFGKVRPANRALPGEGPYIMLSGNNMAITSDLYLRAGGFERTSIDVAHEDRELFLKIRKLTTRYAFLRSVRVRTSSRRVDAWGIVATLDWYRSHRKPSGTVDIR